MIRIHRHEKLCHCPAAVQLGLEGLVALQQRGLVAPELCGLTWSYPALSAQCEEGRTVGVMVYSDQDWRRALFIDFGYVEPTARKRGVYRALWKELCAVAREKDYPMIVGITHRNNREMQAVMQHLGREMQWLTYEYALPPTEAQDE